MYVLVGTKTHTIDPFVCANQPFHDINGLATPCSVVRSWLLFCRFSGGRFYQESKMTGAREWREQQIKQKAPDSFKEYVTTLPSPKFPAVVALTDYIRAVTSRLPDLLAHYGSLPHRKWRMKVQRPSSVELPRLQHASKTVFFDTIFGIRFHLPQRFFTCSESSNQRSKASRCMQFPT